LDGKLGWFPVSYCKVVDASAPSPGLLVPTSIPNPLQPVLPQSQVSPKPERAGAALGPHTVQILEIEALSKRANRKYSSSTVYFPATVPSQQALESIVIVPGWACSENSIAAWGSFFASQLTDCQSNLV
jgi:hypothetical protein